MNSGINKNNNKNGSENPPVKKKSPESSLKRRLKYGSVAMIFTIAFIAVIFVANIVTTTVNSVKPMMIDMTKEQIYGITDASRELLKDVKEPIEIVFFQPVDQYEKLSPPYGKMVVNCIKMFENEYDNITIRTVDIIKTPSAKNEFTTSDISPLQTTSIGIKSQGKSKLLGFSSFFTIASSTGAPMGFAGERTVTSAILQAVDMDYPLVYFTTGHSESAPAELVELFTTNGFTLEQIDLSRQDIAPEAKILVICNPQKDFLGADPNNPSAKSEIDKVASFLNNFGSVMYFSSPEIGAMPELDDLLKEYGIAFEHGVTIADKEKSLNSNEYFLSADYYEANNVGDELHASIRKLPSLPKTIVPYAKPIQILSTTSASAVSPVLTSSSSSYKIYSDGTTSAQGVSNLLVVALKTQYVDNNPKTSLFMVCGSVNYLAALPSSAYSNSDIMLNAMRIMTNKKIAVDIKWKEFDQSGLIMSMEDQNKWTLICILLLPSIVSLTGVAVWLWRRHS